MVKGKELGKIMADLRRKIQMAKERLENIKRENAVNSLVEGKEVANPEQ